MKVFNQPLKQQFLIVLWLFIFAGIFPVNAITPAQTPIYVGITAAKPNIMLMIDSSGSMSELVISTHTNISPGDAPSNFTYNCPISNRLSGGVTPPGMPQTSIYLKVNNSGTVQVCTTTSCSKTVTFSAKQKGKCFNNALNYQVAYYNQSPLSGGPYTGLTLNWYLSSGSFTPGSLTSTITTSSTRSAIAKEAASDLIDSLTPDSGSTVRMGLSRYNGSDGGSLLSEIKDLDLTQANSLKTKISTIPASGITPLATTLSDIGKYFATGETGTLKIHPTSSSSSSASINSIFSKADGATSHSIKNDTGYSGTISAPILGYCQKSFAILISDGLPNGDREISPLLRDYTGDCAIKSLCVATPDNNINLPGITGVTSPVTLKSTGSACSSSGGWYNKACKNGTKVGRAYETDGSDYLDDVAQALFEMDLRPSLDTSKKTQNKIKNNLMTYAIGLADANLEQQSVLSDAAAVGGGKFYFAGDADALASALDDTISDLSSKIGSSSSVAANSSRLGTGSVIYQAKFDSANWFGFISAFPLADSEDVNVNGKLDSGEDVNGNGKLDGGSIGNKIWNAAELIPAFTARKLHTFNPTSQSGAAFICSELSKPQQTTLGIGNCNSLTDEGVWRLNYIRGDGSHEVINPNRKDTETVRTGSNLIFRNRTYLDKITGNTLAPDPWVLGDIVNSDPLYVSDENYRYDKLPGNEGASYNAFVIKNKARRKMLFIGANDGMLHGFDGEIDNNYLDAGKEIFAYIPNSVYNELVSLSKPIYNHAYSVDGLSRVSDVYYNNVWHTVLLGSTGAGGKALFALDITDPSNFGNSNVLWEISDANAIFAADLSIDTQVSRGFARNLGYTIPQSSIARMQDGTWVAIVANGYASANNLAVLYIIDIKTGHLIKAIDTQAGNETNPNGLSTPIVVDTNDDKMVDVIYAGDLLGNLWKFDVSSANVSDWSIANKGAPLFVACSDSANCNATRQPITGSPEVSDVGTQQLGGFMVYFGTGKYFEDIDNTVANAQTQSFYGIWDKNVVVDKSNLQQQSIIAEVTSGGFNLRGTTDNSVNYPAIKGWYMNLLEPLATSSIGERVVSTPLLRNGRIVFESLIPRPPINSTEICGAGSDGTSWLMELDALTGMRLGPSTGLTPWDITDDGMIDSKDLIIVTIGDKTLLVAPSGKESNVGMVMKPPGVVSIEKGSLEYKYTIGTNAAVTEVTTEISGSFGLPTGRRSWRQLFQ
jgi:type IV pilus assembly protein PilY1